MYLYNFFISSSCLLNTSKTNRLYKYCCLNNSIFSSHFSMSSANIRFFNCISNVLDVLVAKYLSIADIISSGDLIISMLLYIIFAHLSIFLFCGVTRNIIFWRFLAFKSSNTPNQNLLSFVFSKYIAIILLTPNAVNPYITHKFFTSISCSFSTDIDLITMYTDI